MLEKLFGFDSSTMTLRKEVIGGITTFLTMAYILAVNPSILSVTGMDAGAVFTTTCISAVVATLVMAVYAKLPFALAPGMGLNAFFAFTVVLTMGYSWQFALTAVMIEGLGFPAVGNGAGIETDGSAVMILVAAYRQLRQLDSLRVKEFNAGVGLGEFIGTHLSGILLLEFSFKLYCIIKYGHFLYLPFMCENCNDDCKILISFCHTYFLLPKMRASSSD